MIAVALYFRGFCGVRRIFNVMLRHLQKPVLTVLRWQLAATAVLEERWAAACLALALAGADRENVLAQLVELLAQRG